MRYHFKTPRNRQSDHTEEVCCAEKLHNYFQVSVFIQRRHWKSRGEGPTWHLLLCKVSKPQCCSCGEIPSRGGDFFSVWRPKEAPANNRRCVIPQLQDTSKGPGVARKWSPSYWLGLGKFTKWSRSRKNGSASCAGATAKNHQMVDVTIGEAHVGRIDNTAHLPAVNAKRVPV